MKKSLLLLALGAVLTLGSCAKIDDDDSKRFISGYFTAEGSLKDGYTLYQDGGGIAIPTRESVVSLTGKNGFKVKRALLNISYKQKDVKDVGNGLVLNVAEITGGEYMVCHDVYSAEEAEKQKVSVADSCFKINKMLHVWAYRGFVNARLYADVSIKKDMLVEPDANLVYDPADIAENKIDFTLIYNRRTSKSVVAATERPMSCSFPFGNLSEMIPGTDSVKVSIKADGVDPVTIKIDRKNLKQADYIPYSY